MRNHIPLFADRSSHYPCTVPSGSEPADEGRASRESVYGEPRRQHAMTLVIPSPERKVGVLDLGVAIAPNRGG